jgi:hypothetical protein
VYTAVREEQHSYEMVSGNVVVRRPLGLQRSLMITLIRSLERMKLSSGGFYICYDETLCCCLVGLSHVLFRMVLPVVYVI